MVVRQGRSTIDTIDEQLGAIDGRPQRHVFQYSRIEIGGRGIDAGRGVRQLSQPDLVVGNDGDITQCQRLPESLVVSKNEQLVFLDRPAQRAAELVTTERRYRALVEKVFGIQIAVAKKL